MLHGVFDFKNHVTESLLDEQQRAFDGGECNVSVA
jgi:hypothetical protein